ncbi:hypothetical protein RQP46_001524 [Phenoliferia psychrophenolica]
MAAPRAEADLANLNPPSSGGAFSPNTYHFLPVTEDPFVPPSPTRQANLAANGATENDAMLARPRPAFWRAETDEESSTKESSQVALGRGVGEGGKAGIWARMSTRRKLLLLAAALLVIVAIAVGTAVPLTHKSSKNSNNAVKGGGTKTSSALGGTPTATANGTALATGRDGSVVLTEDGSTFIYNNSFGGFWNAIPFSDSAQAQSDVPPLDQRWDYSTNLISGVNLGGWLVIEPFIAPALFEPFNPAGSTATPTVIDEWTLCLALGTNMSTVIENHYATFITEKDFAEIAGAGLNWVRIPVPYWMIEVESGEPFLANVAWKYFLKAITWARKYGLRINIDLHAVPGSQNGYNHSSKYGTINFLNGVMGIANAQRTLNYIRTLTEFITQPQYANVIPMLSVLNEPYAYTITLPTLRHFYLETYNMMRDISGIGEGKGPWIGFHDAFADKLPQDTHPYLIFTTPNNDTLSYQASKPCSWWSEAMNASTLGFGLTIAGEWSVAINDCGKWINNVGNGQRYDGTYITPGETTVAYDAVGSCDSWDAWWDYTPAIKAGLKNVAEAHMDSLRHWFFWTWKTGYSSQVGNIVNPQWNYQLGLEQGYIPANPRTARGVCPSLLAAAGVEVAQDPAPTLSPWMTGGTGAGTILATDQLSSFGAWPPLSLGSTVATNFPTFTPTGVVTTLQPEPTPTSLPAGVVSVGSPGNGWADSNDNGGWLVKVAGCSYPNPWSGVAATVPTAPCTGSALARRTAGPVATALPTQRA